MFFSLYVRPLATKLHTTVGGHRLDAHKMQFRFLGHNVGRACLCAILAIGKSRFAKCVSLQHDMRIGKSKAGTQRCAASVDAFLTVIYNGVAETLPDRRASSSMQRILISLYSPYKWC